MLRQKRQKLNRYLYQKCLSCHGCELIKPRVKRYANSGPIFLIHLLLLRSRPLLPLSLFIYLVWLALYKTIVHHVLKSTKSSVNIIECSYFVSKDSAYIKAFLKYSLLHFYFCNLHVFSWSSSSGFPFSSSGCFVFEPVRCFGFEFREFHFRASRALRFRVRTRASFSSSGCFVRAWALCASVLTVYECFVCRTYHKKHLGKLVRRRITKVNNVGLLFRGRFKFNLNVEKKPVVNNLAWRYLFITYFIHMTSLNLTNCS